MHSYNLKNHILKILILKYVVYSEKKNLLVFSENTWDTNDKDRFPLFGRGTAANSVMTKWTLIVIVLITTIY